MESTGPRKRREEEKRRMGGKRGGKRRKKGKRGKWKNDHFEHSFSTKFHFFSIPSPKEMANRWIVKEEKVENAPLFV